MAHADEEALKRLLPLLRQLREIKGLREMKPGIFYLKGSAFLHFHDEAGALVGDLKRSIVDLSAKLDALVAQTKPVAKTTP